MIEKTIQLESIVLVDFLGVQNENIKTLSRAFPKTRIISRGNTIKIQGSDPEIIKVHRIIQFLIEYYQKHGKVSSETIHSYFDTDIKELIKEQKNDIIIFGTQGTAIKPKNANQRALVNAVEKHDLVFAVGPAGTGKTYIAVAMAVKALKNKSIRKIIITRPAVEAGENLGFLPGDLKEKIDPYLRPIYDALGDMIPSEKLKFYLESNIIEIAPLAYMRGRTLNKAYILLDESQNTTSIQMKMFLTRMGSSSKMIVTGDRSQIDLPHNHKSGLLQATEVLKDVEGVSMIELTGDDVMRHKLIKKIIHAYQKKTQ